MDYEEKYNAALERAAKLRVQNPFDTVGQMVEHIFPELKENENEKIRKDILCYFEHYAHDINGIDVQKWINWLEKQGKQNDSCWNKDDQKMLEHIISDLREFMFCETDKELISDYEKEIAWLEKQGEKKPVDKVEPKFHEGDWVVNKFGDSWHIDSFDEENYQVSNGKGNYNWFPISKQDEMYLWTIQDAKDGDVLTCCDNKPFIFKGFFGLNFSNCLEAYCGITLENQFRYCNGKTFWTNQDVKPSTKEQRDLLFQKMADACYEWDSEKKELKKIEQNIVDNVEPKFHPGDWVIDNIGYIYQIESATEIESEHIFGYTIVGGGYFNDNNDVRLWSIDDAKCGDVLVDKYNNVGIYKEIEGVYWDSYIYLGCDGVIRGFSIGGRHEQTGTHPATKEQCDLFFAKMKEAGWERIVKIKN